MNGEERVIGTKLIFRGMEFHLIFDTDSVKLPSPDQGFIFRPSQLVFEGKQRSHTVVMTWPPGTILMAVALTESRKRKRQ
jgi:hypothetical protein